MDPAEVADRLDGKIKGSVTLDAPLARSTTFRLGGNAEVLIHVTDEDDLKAISDAVSGTQLPLHILGRGSNVLISDAGVKGVVVRLGKGFEWIRDTEDKISAGGLTPFPKVANRAWRLGLGGLEFCVAIPATVGGAVRMNAGAHDSSVSEVLISASVFSLLRGTSQDMDPEALGMTYRESSLGPTDIVCAASFGLKPDDPALIEERMKAYRDHRTQTQPVDAPNAGSTFRNPEGDSAGRLIEESGLKGTKVGGAKVSELHANFFVATEGATSQDIYDLMTQVQSKVEEDHGVLLVPEVHPIGEFSGEPLRWR